MRKLWAYSNVPERLSQGEGLCLADVCGCKRSADGSGGHWPVMWWESSGEDEGGRADKDQPLDRDHDHGSQLWCLSHGEAILEQEQFGSGL